MIQSEKDFAYLIEGLSIDTSNPWWEWDWKKAGAWTSYNWARLEEYRDSVFISYRLYNRIGLEHAKRMLFDAPRDAKLLDAGGGTGRKAIPLAQEGFADITIVDIASEWLHLAEEKANGARVSERIKLVEGDVLDMCDFPDNEFDYVLALGGVVSYSGDPATAIGEMARVLKPGGELLADGIHSRFGDMRGAARAGNLDRLEELAYSTGEHRQVAVILPEKLEALAHQAGLSDVRVWSEFIFMPDDKIRIGSDTERWENVVLEVEMRHYDDARFLGVANLILHASKHAA